MVDLYLNTIHILKLQSLCGRVYKIEMKINSECNVQLLLTIKLTLTTK